MSSSSSSWEVVWFKTLLQTRGFWSSHDNGEGFVYYYNRQTRESTWQCPFREEETSEVFDVKKSAMDISGVWSMHESKKHGMVYYFNQNSGKSSWSRPVDFHLPLEHQISWEDVSSSSFAAQPTDKQIQEFYAMLDDKNITADSSWESVLPKIAYDRRFTAVSGMTTRKSLLAHYVSKLPDKVSTTSQQGLRQLAKLLATPLAAQRLTAASTFESFLQSLDGTARTRLAEALVNVPQAKQHALFQKRLQLLKPKMH